MKKLSVIPNIRVNYSLLNVICSFFINNKDYNSELKKVLYNLFSFNNIILTQSGRSAIYHVLSNLPQKKVIIPAYTCDVVAEAAILAEKHLFFAPVDINTLNIADIPELDGNSVFIATHQYGLPCKIKEISFACKQKGAILIEDCAGALGTEIDGQMAGTFGDFAIFSFNASKLINSPATGGFLIAKKESDLVALRDSIEFKSCTFRYKLKNIIKSTAFCLDKNAHIHFWLSRIIRHDVTKAYISAESYHPDRKILEDYHYGFYNWQAFVVLKQLNRLPLLLKKREELAVVYKTRLNQVYQKEEFERQPCCIRYPVFLKNREAIRKRIRELGVEVGAGFEHFVCPLDYRDELVIGKEVAYLPYSSNYSSKEINSIVAILNQVADEQSINS